MWQNQWHQGVVDHICAYVFVLCIGVIGIVGDDVHYFEPQINVMVSP